jgi:hypothetical protein
MSVLEIVLLAIGLIIFIVSFLIPDKNSSDASKIDGEALLAEIEEKVEESKQKIDEMTDETLSYSMEKTERAIDKLANEKILAIGDYSDTVIDEISKDHNEVVFLSDMLNKNKKDLTTLLLKAVETSRTATESANGAYDLAENASKLADEAMEKAKKAGSAADFAEDKMISVKKKMIEGDAAEIKIDTPAEAEKSIDEEKKTDEMKKTAESKKTVKKSQKKTEAGSEAKEEKTSKASKASKAKSAKEDKAEKAAKESKNDTEKAVKKEKSAAVKKASEGAQISLSDLEEADSAPIRTMNETSGDAAAELFKKASGALRFDTSADGNGNNNERILAMHRLGRSNMAIARELGLGVGEVKLVIDLYQNML